jgi:hypothetical protein
MKHLRTIKRSDLGRLVYKYSHRARFLGIDVAFAFGKDYIMGNLTYFKRCPFHYVMTKPESFISAVNENKIFIPANPACCGFSSNPILDLIKSELERKE